MDGRQLLGIDALAAANVPEEYTNWGAFEQSWVCRVRACPFAGAVLPKVSDFKKHLRSAVHLAILAQLPIRTDEEEEDDGEDFTPALIRFEPTHVHPQTLSAPSVKTITSSELAAAPWSVTASWASAAPDPAAHLSSVLFSPPESSPLGKRRQLV